MGRQIGLALAAEDLGQFMKALQATGDTIVVRNITDASPDRIVRVDSLEMTEEFFFYLIPFDIPLAVRVDHHGRGKYRANLMESNIVQLWKPVVDGGEMHPGRLYYEPKAYRDGQLVPKSPTFVAWAERTVSRARRALFRDARSGLYLGTHARQLLAEGAISLA